MENLTPTQLFQDQWNALRFEALTYGLSILSLGSIGLAALQDSLPGKFAAFSVSTGLAAGARASKVGAQRTSARAVDVRNVSDIAQTQVLFDTMTGKLGEEAAIAGVLWKPDNLFDLRNLAIHPDKYPHVMVVGGTGDGKSTLVEWIIDQERESRRYYISPTRDDYEFLNYEVAGCGIRDGKQYALDYQEITQAIQYLVNESHLRYQMRAGAAAERGYINAVLDEYRLTAKIGKELEGVDAVQLISPITGTVMSYGDAVSYLVTVARKRFIRLWLLLQSETVKATGLEGEGDIRESLVKLRLGDFARNHLRKLISQGTHPQEALRWFDAQPTKQVCMVDDQLALVPMLAGYQQNKAQSLSYDLPQLHQVFVEAPAPSGNTPIYAHRERSAPDVTLYSDLPGEGVSGDTEPPASPQIPQDDNVASLAPSSPPKQLSPEISPETLAQFDELVKVHGQKKTKVLKAAGYWGDKYKEGGLIWNAYIEHRNANPMSDKDS